jgi:ABC-type dipeptide/oligopeptide/nickel transport system permease subunit
VSGNVETETESDPGESNGTRSRGPWRRAARRYLRRPAGVVAHVVLLALAVVGAEAGRIARYAVNFVDLAHLNQAAGPTLVGDHFFGTDYLGRDLFSQTLYGLRTSVLIALMVAAAAAVLGVLVGAVAGYLGGWEDAILMRGVDLVVTVPVMVVTLVSFSYFKPLTPRDIGFVLILYMWTTVARVVRASCASLREREFVEAAHALGASALRVVVRHLLPNSMGPALVAATAVIGQALVLEATIDFFSLGTTQLSGPTLGNLVADATKYGVPIAQVPWWSYTCPSLVLVPLCQLRRRQPRRGAGGGVSYASRMRGSSQPQTRSPTMPATTTLAAVTTSPASIKNGSAMLSPWRMSEASPPRLKM